MNKVRNFSQSLFQSLIFLFLAGIMLGNSNTQISNTATEVDNIPSYFVNPDGATQQSLPPLIEDVKYVQLQFPEEMYLREIRKVIFKKSSFYLFESSPTGDHPKIFSFDHSGHLNYVIDKPGRGPGEFETVYDFAITETSIVLSTRTKLMFYDKESGKFIKSLDRPKESFVQIIAMLDDKTLVSSANRTIHNRSKNLVKIYDIKREEYVFEAIPFQQHALKVGHTYRYFFSVEDTLSVIPMYEQTVYRVKQEHSDYSLRPAYKFDFGEYWIADNLLANSYNNRDEFFSSSSDYVHTVDVFETKNVIYAHYNLQGRDYTFLFDKELRESSDITSFTDDNIGWIGKPEAVHEDWIINLVTPFEIEDADIQPNEKLSEILSNMNDKGQPFFIFARF